MGGATLLSAINRTLFAAGSDDLRPVMSGIFFELYADNVRFVAQMRTAWCATHAQMHLRLKQRRSSFPRSR